MDMKTESLVKYWHKQGIGVVELANKYQLSIEQIIEIIDGEIMPLFKINDMEDADDNL